MAVLFQTKTRTGFNNPENSDKDIDYEISSIDGSLIGNLSKQWSGLLQESFTDADNFGVSFPIDLDVKCKLSLLAAVFLIVSDVNYWTKMQNFFRTSCFTNKNPTIMTDADSTFSLMK